MALEQQARGSRRARPAGRRHGRGSGGGPGKAGRNLPLAIAVGVALGGVVLASLYTVKATFVAVAAAALGVALWELRRALLARDIDIPLVPLLAGSVAMLAGAFWRGADALAVAFGLTALAVLAWRLPEGSRGYVRHVTGGIFAAAYLPFFAGFAMLLLAQPDGNHRVLTWIAVAVCSDIGGYVAGVLLGRHPMAPAISPKKTWEGTAGSVIVSVAAGVALVPLLLHGGYWQGAVFAGAVVLTAIFGDLVESMIKRDLGIKDMGSVLPGHGGVMERLDSLLTSAPVAWLALMLLVPPPA